MRPQAPTAAGPALRIPVPHGINVGEAMTSLAAHAVPGTERHLPNTHSHTRVIAIAGRPVAVTVTLRPNEIGITTVPHLSSPADRQELIARVRFWFDLDTDIRAVEAHLSGDPALAPLVALRPSLRVVRHHDGFEAAVCTVIGQHVSMAAARTFAGRLVAAYGTNGPDGLVIFPGPDRLASIPAEELREATGITTARAQTVVALAGACATEVDLGLGRPPADNTALRELRVALLAIPGIGPWTVDYLAVRAFGAPDTFLAGDLVARRALGNPSPARAAARAEHWSPWRSYALMHVWALGVRGGQIDA